MYWRRESNWMGCYMQTVKTVDNCIVVFNKDKTKVLFCKHKKDPFKGTLNFVGGKVESGESPEDAAYRELQEETGISRRKIRLYRLMDMRYYHQDLLLQIFVGQLYEDITLAEEATPFSGYLWMMKTSLIETDLPVRRTLPILSISLECILFPIAL